jgi:ribose transport system permease protein
MTMIASKTKMTTMGSGPSNVKKVVAFLIKYNTMIIFFLLVIASGIFSDAFLTEKNVFNLLRQVASLGIISMGMLLVIITGGIDSVGSIIALASVTSAYLYTKSGMPMSVAIILTIAVAALLGSTVGYLVSKRNMAPFVATLALMTIAKGLAFILSKGSPIMVSNEGLDMFGTGYFLRIPLPVWLMLGIVTLVTLTLRYTVFGRLVTAIGSNETAVKLTGIRVSRYKFIVYMISAALASFGGIISTSRTGVGSPLVGDGAELDAIAAVVIGGASLAGGKGSAVSTFFGVLILGTIGNIMNLMHVPGYPQQVIKGLIIIFAVLFQSEKES